MKRERETAVEAVKAPTRERTTSEWAADALARCRESLSMVGQDVNRRMAHVLDDMSAGEAPHDVDKHRAAFETAIARARDGIDRVLAAGNADRVPGGHVPDVAQLSATMRRFLTGLEEESTRLAARVGDRLDAGAMQDLDRVFERTSAQVTALADELEAAIAQLDVVQSATSFVDGAVRGDFSDDPSASATVGRIVGGLNPLADLRDIAAGVVHVAQGKEGAWQDLALAGVGAVPGLGDAAKAIGRAGGDVVQEGVERLIKERGGRTAADEFEDFQRMFPGDGPSGKVQVTSHGRTKDSTAPVHNPLARDVELNIDEKLPVGDPDRKVTMAERRRRALSLENREFKDQITNQRTKHMRIDPRDLEKPGRREIVSIAGAGYGQLFARSFGEIAEMQEIGARALKLIDGKSTRLPGELKEELNRRIWAEIRKRSSPEGRLVGEAISRAGFELVTAPSGRTVLRALDEQELHRRGMTFVAGQGWIKRTAR
jgi:hypothetical protein